MEGFQTVKIDHFADTIHELMRSPGVFGGAESLNYREYGVLGYLLNGDILRIPMHKREYQCDVNHLLGIISRQMGNSPDSLALIHNQLLLTGSETLNNIPDLKLHPFIILPNLQNIQNIAISTSVYIRYISKRIPELYPDPEDWGGIQGFQGFQGIQGNLSLEETKEDNQLGRVNAMILEPRKSIYTAFRGESLNELKVKWEANPEHPLILITLPENDRIFDIKREVAKRIGKHEFFFDLYLSDEKLNTEKTILEENLRHADIIILRERNYPY